MIESKYSFIPLAISIRNFADPKIIEDITVEVKKLMKNLSFNSVSNRANGQRMDIIDDMNANTVQRNM